MGSKEPVMPSVSSKSFPVPKLAHRPLESVQHMHTYLEGTADLGLTYGPPNPNSQSMLQACCDTNYAGDGDKRHSTTGHASFIEL